MKTEPLYPEFSKKSPTSVKRTLSTNKNRTFIPFSGYVLIRNAYTRYTAMTISKEFLTDLKEKFEKVQKALQQENKVDDLESNRNPCDECYDVLNESLEYVLGALDDLDNSSEDFASYELIKGYIYKELGRLDVVLNRSSTAVGHLSHALEVLKDRQQDPNAVIHCVAALTELGLNAANQKKNVDARQHLETAEKLYKDFKATGETPVTIFEFLSSSDDIEKREGRVELGKLYTLVTYYLAQVLSHLDETEKSAVYCHITLKRLLEADNYNAIDWALNAATLSQYYLTPNRFTEARHVLAAATHMLLEYEKKMVTPEMSFDEEQAVQETFNHRFADIARCWTKYALTLLIESRERLMSDDTTPRSPPVLPGYQFTTLQLPPYEVTDKYCLTFEDARQVYHFAMKWIERSKQYYNAQLEATEYAVIISDEADLYKVLAFFEEDPQIQCKYYKKRADLLEHIISLLNPTYYLMICRQAWYDAAMSYSTMMDTKMDILKATEDPTPHQRKKINTLSEKAINHLKSLINSFNEKSSIPDDEMHIYLCAHFYIGRLFYKVLTPDRKQQLKNLRNSYRYYEKFVLLCEENKEAGSRLKAEVGVCKEMLSLLPVKIENLVKEIEEAEMGPV